MNNAGEQKLNDEQELDGRRKPASNCSRCSSLSKGSRTFEYLKKNSAENDQHDQKTLPCYPDVGDNVYANVCSWLDVNCGDSENKWFIPGQCTDHGHRYAKVIYCGKEWCPVCGQVGSGAHNRRYVRWISKIQQFSSMVYFIPTIPHRLIYKFRSKQSLKDLGRMAQLMMIKHGFKRGLRRWHWFGDKTTEYEPHLNMLVDGEYIKPCKLMIMRYDWSEILGIKFSESNIYTSYKRTPNDMAGCLFYVTRSTFNNYTWDLDMAIELRNFRNMVVWGRDWKNEPKWELEKIDHRKEYGRPLDIYSIEKLLDHTCPVCQSKMEWGKALPDRILQLTDHLDLGAGFYAIIDRSAPAHLKDQDQDRLALLHLLKVAKTLGAVPENELAQYEKTRKKALRKVFEKSRYRTGSKHGA